MPHIGSLLDHFRNVISNKANAMYMLVRNLFDTMSIAETHWPLLIWNQMS